MIDLPVFLQMFIVFGLIVVPSALVIRTMSGREDWFGGSFLARSAALPWPRGVQEEEPLPWRTRSAVPDRRRPERAVASRVGFEPTTKGLKVPCSAAELPAR